MVLGPILAKHEPGDYGKPIIADIGIRAAKPLIGHYSKSFKDVDSLRVSSVSYEIEVRAMSKLHSSFSNLNRLGLGKGAGRSMSRVPWKGAPRSTTNDLRCVNITPTGDTERSLIQM